MALQAAIALEAEAAQELSAGNIEAAFRLSDRRCRIPPHPQPHCYVLRAEALSRMGRRDLALGDIRRALAMAPDDVAANRRMLLWADGEDRLAAALALAGHDRDRNVQGQALAVLRAGGRRVFAQIGVTERRIDGWAAWDGREPVDVTVTDGTSRQTWQIAPDPLHVFCGDGSAAGFDLPRPVSRETQTVEVRLRGRLITSIRAVSSAPRRSPRADRRLPVATSAGATVIIPVYGDYEATRACIEGVRDALRGKSHHRVILIDDATPDTRIADYLRGLAGVPGIRLLVNAANLGFVGSINRALDETAQGDVLLLNADTIVPPSFIDDLAAVARSSPAIGTVTPLSNNGEFTSFPLPNRANPLRTPAGVRELHGLASSCNPGLVVDIPSGIGFCLYVTRACLEATGPLSEDYHRGYLEDADFCLRARERGFRNVCAASVYVGHAGGRSFAQHKRALVVRNLAILERRYPGHRPECAAFIAADPLRMARQAIERRLKPSATRPRLLVTTAGAMTDIALDRARRLRRAAHPTLIIQAGDRSTGDAVMVYDPAGGVPQSLRFDLADACDHASFARYIEDVAASRIEVFDLMALPDPLLRLLRAWDVPVHIVVANPDLMAVLGATGEPAVPRCWPERAPPLPGDRAPAASRMALQLALIDDAEKILVPDQQAEALLSGAPIRLTSIAPDRPRAGRRSPGDDDHKQKVHLGIVPVTRSMREQRLIGEIVRELARLRPDTPVTILGALANESQMMEQQAVFVTGRIDEADLAECVAMHGIGHLLIALDRPLFGHPIAREARRCGVPAAYADWSMGVVPPLEGDLPIDPRLPLAAAAGHIAAWLPQ